MSQESDLARAISLTDEILEVLDQGEFERIGELDKLRQPLIKQVFTESIEQIDLIKARHLQNLNQQVVDRLSLFKESILEHQARVRNASKAARAYANAGLSSNTDPN